MKPIPERVEEIRDWIETCLDADAHGSWTRSPNFQIIQDVAELMAPRFASMLTETDQQARESVNRQWLDAMNSQRVGDLCAHYQKIKTFFAVAKDSTTPNPPSQV